ncbi:response regulator transcription factor [Anaeromicrobium sediminis]|uniref:Stage 0 sporulation protein A homolog n=1 Tax=Anaeromicrobium sediminis TaxID=1478221 RepID=A0A267MML4_9FIRM|nr:response regulator transcription factor [Anaeromicrobium sediminis]PAB60053.1 DNA-binding response regulator [Anaeromicrobium sediminis]
MDKILVVDDEKTIADTITYALDREGYTVEAAYDGEDALNKISAFNPDVVILDVMMPKMSGFEVCKRLENKAGLGIILLTAKDDIVDKILGLELGADDYITKPFHMRELVARAKSLLRRLQKNSDEEQEKITIRDLEVILQHRKVQLHGQSLNLTPKEFDLLTLLLSHMGRVYTRDQLLDIVWGMEYAGGTRTVDIHIQRLRKKLGESYQNILQTIHGVGYKAIGEIYED